MYNNYRHSSPKRRETSDTKGFDSVRRAFASTYIYYKTLAGGARSEWARVATEIILLHGFAMISLLNPSIGLRATVEVATSARNVARNEIVCSCEEV